MCGLEMNDFSLPVSGQNIGISITSGAWKWSTATSRASWIRWNTATLSGGFGLSPIFRTLQTARRDRESEPERFASFCSR